ncbi:MAG TPA: VCBS repeat-containing protein, partial [Blastocatellia bacterium]|nr:VCBS repeat-containing protein [Blastocatellia bacterium]
KDDVMKFDVPSSGISQLGLWVGLSNGSSFAGSRWATWDTYRDMKVLAGDFNGDGRDDVMKFDVFNTCGHGLWVGLSSGSSFNATRWATWCTDTRMQVLAGDFDGDGKADVMKFDVP